MRKFHGALFLVFCLVSWSEQSNAGDGCDAVEKAAEDAAKYYLEDHSSKVIDDTFTPTDDLGKKSCIDEIRDISLSIGLSIPSIVVKEIIDQVLNAACEAAMSAVQEGISQVTGSLASYEMPYGLGRAGVDITQGSGGLGNSGVNVQRTKSKINLPSFGSP